MSIKIGDKVIHDFSETLGEVKAIADYPSRGYKYFIYWFDDPERSDWYKEDVLVLAKEQE